MKQKHLNERDRQLKANLRALITESKVPLGRLKNFDLAKLASAFPDMVEDDGELASRSKESSSVYHWPITSNRQLIGLAICEEILKRTNTRSLASFKAQNITTSHLGTKALFDLLCGSDYWHFTASFKVDEKIRKNTAIEYGLSAVYIWPKTKTQFAYITRSPMLVSECPYPDCEGVIGTFIVRAPVDGTPYVEHGQAFYLLKENRLVERGEWKSRTFAVNDLEFVILYELSYTNDQQYQGLISAKRVQDDVAIRGVPCLGELVTGTRAFRGHFHAFRKTAVEAAGEFYCEELDRILEREGEIRVLLAAAATELVEQLRWSRGIT